MASATNWTEIGVLLTAIFTGATVLAMVALDYLHTRRKRLEDERRYELKVLIGKQMDELTARLLYNNTGDEFDSWVTRTAKLIDASLGRMEEQWILEPIPGGARVSDAEEKRKALLKAVHLRLQDLALRMDAIPLRPDFDPKQWPPSGSDT